MTEQDAATDRLRAAYRSGGHIADIIRNEPVFKGMSPSEIMFVFMRAFDIGLSDVACIDGWWPPSAQAEVTDDNLDLFIRHAIDARWGEGNVPGA